MHMLIAFFFGTAPLPCYPSLSLHSCHVTFFLPPNFATSDHVTSLTIMPLWSMGLGSHATLITCRCQATLVTAHAIFSSS